MSRIQLALTILISVLLGVLFWVVVHSPQQDELENLERAIEDEEAQHVVLRNRIETLRQVRADAPELEATLASSGAVVPRDPSLPSALRQLQSAADESGITLRSVTTTRPSILDGELGLSNIPFSVQLEGSYFQTVDFIRRIEDPSITPRAMLWSGANIARVEHPQLTVGLSGDLFTLAPPEEADPVEPDPETEDGEELNEEDELIEQEDEL